VARSILSDQGFSPPVVATLQDVFDAIWTEVEPNITLDNAGTVQSAVAGALIGMAKASQLSEERLATYARSKALEAVHSAQAISAK
jgi:hypothetical protein